MVAEPSTPGRAWAGQEVWSMANPTKGPGALTLAMTLLGAEARKMIPCTKPPWQRVEPSRIDPGGLRRLAGLGTSEQQPSLGLIYDTVGSGAKCLSVTLGLTAKLSPSLQGAKAGRRETESSPLHPCTEDSTIQRPESQGHKAPGSDRVKGRREGVWSFLNLLNKDCWHNLTSLQYKDV